MDKSGFSEQFSCFLIFFESYLCSNAEISEILLHDTRQPGHLDAFALNIPLLCV